MIQAVQKIERSIKERRETDIPLMNWWLYTLIVNPITCGIYGVVMFFKRTNRVDKFIARKKNYYQSLLEFNEKYSQEKNRYNEIRNELNDLKDSTNAYVSTKMKQIKAGTSFLLILVTLGIWAFVWLYRMNKVWNDLQKVEQEFDDRISQIWIKIGLIKYPLSFHVDPSKNRSYALYLILTFVTFGIWGLVWDYKIHTDPDNLYKEFHLIEDTVLQTVRQV